MSKVVKGAKNVVKKIGNLIEKVDPLIRWVKKGFKKVWSTTVGKVVISAIAIYFGGWALGAWGGPGGLFGGAAAAAPTAGTSLANAAAGGITATASGSVGAGVGATAAGSVAADAGLLGMAGTAAKVAGGTSAVQGAAQAAAPVAAETAASAGLGMEATNAAVNTKSAFSMWEFIRGGADAAARGIGKLAGNTASFVGEHPEAALIAGGSIANMMTPTAQEVAEEERQQYNDRLYGVGDIPLWDQPTGRVTRMSGRPIYDAEGLIT